MSEAVPLNSSVAVVSDATSVNQLSDAAALDVVARWERVHGGGPVVLALVGTFVGILYLLATNRLVVNPSQALFVALATWVLASAHAFALWSLQRRAFLRACSAGGLDREAIAALDQALQVVAADAAGLSGDRRRQMLFLVATRRRPHNPIVDDVD